MYNAHQLIKGFWVNRIIGVSDMQVSGNPGDTLITYSLGSCIGISIYDQHVKVGGLLHFMLPDSNLDRNKALKNPFMFADTGILALIRAASKLGVRKERMKVIIAGGAKILDEKGFFNIGKKNYQAAKIFFAEHHLAAAYEDVGGKINRTLSLSIKTGQTKIKAPGKSERRI